jgi:hypothetical protein
MVDLKEHTIRCDGGVKATSPLRQLRTLVLLAGTIRRSPLIAAIGRPIFELPLRKHWTILDQWQREAQALAALTEDAVLPVRVAVNRAARPIARRQEVADIAAPVSIHRDRCEYRGAAGVVRDLLDDYADDDCLLVATAAQLLNRPLNELAVAMGDTSGDVAAIVHRDCTPSGLFLMRCGAVRDLPAVGFVDLKEQAMRSLADRYRIMAVPICTLAGYIEAIRTHHLGPEDTRTADPFAELHHAGFVIVEDGAKVHPSAIIHDSVVLKGATMEAGAVAVRSLIGPGAVLRSGDRAVDKLVGGDGSTGRARHHG